MSPLQEPGQLVVDLDYAYKIVAEPLPSPLPHALPLSALDKHDGFLHLSMAGETPHTADRFFADAPTLWLLKLDVRALSEHADGGAFKWAPTPNCVHLYAPQPGQWARLGADTVSGVRVVAKAPGTKWASVMKDLVLEGWLVW